MYPTVLVSVVVVEDEVSTPPPMLSPSRLKVTDALVVTLSETEVEPPRVTETSSVAPPQLWVVCGQFEEVTTRGERKSGLELGVAEDALEANVGVVSDVDLSMEIMSGGLDRYYWKKLRTRVHLSARSRSEEPGPPGQDERRSASPWNPSRPTRPPLGSIETARATAVEREREKNTRENIFEERVYVEKGEEQGEKIL